MKNFPFEWLVGLRYTRADRRSGRNSFISFISAISMAGIALGVAALIVVLSVMNGFQKEIRIRMLSVISHIEIFNVSDTPHDWKTTALEVRKNPSVIASAPYVEAQGMLIGDEVMRGIILRGISPEEESLVSDIAKKIKTGKLNELSDGKYNIILGSELARSLHTNIGEKIRLAAAVDDKLVSSTSVMPKIKAFTVVAIVESGHYEFDSALAFIHINDAQEFFRLSAPSGLRLRVSDLLKAPQVTYELNKILPTNFIARDWSQKNRNYFEAIKTEKMMMFIILTLIVAVAAFNLVSTLVMKVTDKQADIAIFRTLGASPWSIMKIFMIQGTIVGIIGTLFGVGSGVLVSLNVDVIVPFIERIFGVQFLSKELYFISYVPSDLRWADVQTIGIVAIGLSFLATIYPSWRAARVKPAEALRYE